MTAEKLKTALVTGGAARIGAAIVRDLADHDFAVAIHTNSSAGEAEALAAEIRQQGGRAAVVIGDLTRMADCEQIVAAAEAAIGPLGLIVNNASVFQRDSIDEFSSETFDLHLALHVKAPSMLISHFARQLPERRHGLAVNIIDQRVWKLRPDVRIIEGRTFKPGLRELIVGKGALAEFDGTGIGSGSFSPASSRRCRAHVSSHTARLRRPLSLYRSTGRYGTASAVTSSVMSAAGSTSPPLYTAATCRNSGSAAASLASWSHDRRAGSPRGQ